MRDAVMWAVLMALTGAAGAAASDNPIPPVDLEQYTLSNGLTVFLIEDHSVPIVAVNVNYMVGSKNEKPGRTGFAHLFEHMMFQGSKHFNDDYFKPLHEIGAQINGGTNTERTRYWEQVPAAYLERALWLEADRMGFLLDAMTQEGLDNQRSVVKNERRQRYENSPYGLVRETMAEALYPAGHPYSWTTIGSMADLQAASLEDVQEFFRTYYAPNNASLCIAGDFQSEHARELVEEYFGAIPPGPPVTRLDRWVPSLDGEKRLVMQDRVQLARTYFAWVTTPKFSADDAALDVFGRILGQGRTSRLHRRLVYELEIAQDAWAYHDGSQLSGELQMVVSPRPGHTLEEVEAEAEATLAELLDDGITAAELARVQTTITADFVRSRQHVGGFGGLSDRVNEYFHYLGEPDGYRLDLQRYLDLTPESVVAAARRHLDHRRVVIRVEPLPTLAPSSSDLALAVDRTTMPDNGPESSFELGQAPGLFVASAPVQTDVTATAITEAIAELEGMVGGRPVTADELRAAKGVLVNGYAHRFETTGQIARELMDEVMHGLPADALEHFPAAVSEVTAADVAEVAEKRLQLDRLAIVVVGDLVAIRAGVEALELGPIVELDREGKAVAKASDEV